MGGGNTREARAERNTPADAVKPQLIMPCLPYNSSPSMFHDAYHATNYGEHRKCMQSKNVGGAGEGVGESDSLRKNECKVDC